MELVHGKTDCRPEETGYDASRLDVLNRHFERLMEKEIIVGAAYAISHKGKIIANTSMGGRSKVSSEKMQTDTIFRIASITKTFTAVSIMKLIEDGCFRLDTPVGEILPAFSKPPFDKITVWHLLTHTSGLYPDDGCFPDVAPPSGWEFLADVVQKWDGKTEIDWVQWAIMNGIKSPVGSEWMYSTNAFSILGEVISKVSGVFAHDYIENNIMKPLGMTDTSFNISKNMAERMYIRDENYKGWIDAIIKGEVSGSASDGSFWDRVPNTGGGIYSTTTDLLKFANMMLGNGRLNDVRILGRKSVEKMTTQQLKDIPDRCWGSPEKDRKHGIGFDMKEGPAFTYSKGTFMHEGAGGCSMDIDPKEQLAAVWFVPWNKTEWSAEALFSVQNIIWSGIK